MPHKMLFDIYVANKKKYLKRNSKKVYASGLLRNIAVASQLELKAVIKAKLSKGVFIPACAKCCVTCGVSLQIILLTYILLIMT